MQRLCSISVPEKEKSPVTETWQRRDRQCFILVQITCKNEKIKQNTVTCSLKWLVQDVQGLPIVITRGNGTFSLQTKLNPEQSFLFSVNRQCFQLFSYFNNCGFCMTCHIRPLDGFTRQPKQEPAKYVWT